MKEFSQQKREAMSFPFLLYADGVASFGDEGWMHAPTITCTRSLYTLVTEV